MSGTLQLIGVGLPPTAQPGRVLAEIDRVQARGSIRVLDVLLVAKEADGNVVRLALGLDAELGDLISRLVPTDALGDGPRWEQWTPAQHLPADMLGMFILIEHRWAQDTFGAIEQEKGEILSAGFLPAELAELVTSEVATMEETGESVGLAQAAEAQARLRSVIAQAETEAVVATTTQIRAEATAEALRTLTIAGLVESAAAHEALDALIEAGLIIDYADELVARAVDADEAIVAAVDEATGQRILSDAVAIAVAEQRMFDTAMAASVTPAELRVLQFLPTTLSFALIADKLGISRGAAKMRAERAYQKLDVHTRAEAVQRAKELQVLP